MDVRFCKEQEPPPRGTRCELKVLRVLVLRAPHRRALGELFFLLTDGLHGRRPLFQRKLRRRLDSDTVIHGRCDPLGAAEVAFCGLHRDVAKKNLNLL